MARTPGLLSHILSEAKLAAGTAVTSWYDTIVPVVGRMNMRAIKGDVVLAAAFGDRIGAGHVGRVRALSEALSSMGAAAHIAVNGVPDHPSTGTVEPPQGVAPSERRGSPVDDWLPRGIRAVVIDGVSSGNQQLLDCIPPAVPRVVVGAAASAAFGSDVAILPGFRSPRVKSRANRVHQGIEFVPVRADVRAKRKALQDAQREGRDVAYVLSVVLGGTDATGLRSAVVREIQAQDIPGDRFRVFPDPPEGSHNVSVALNRQPKIDVDRNHDCPPDADRGDFLCAITNSSMVLSAAGTTAWELAHLGVPFGLFRAVSNQESTYWGMTTRGWAHPWGLGNGLGRDGRLVEILQQAVRSPGAVRAPLIDGLGAMRIAKLVLSAGN